MRGLLLGVAAALTLSGPVGASGATPSTAAGESPLVYVVIAVDTEADNGHPMEELHTTFDLHNYKRCAAGTAKCSGDGSAWTSFIDGTTFNFKVAPTGGGDAAAGYACGFSDAYGLDRFALAGRFTVAAGGRYDVGLQLAVVGLPPDTKIYVVRDRDGDPDVARPLATYEARVGGFVSGSYVTIASGLSLQAGQPYWWYASRQSAGDAGNRFVVYQGAASGDGATTFAQIMDPAFRGAVTDSDGRPFRMTWYMEMDDFIANGRHADGRRMGYLTLYDELQRSWGEELRGFGDEIAYHHHFMYWDGARWRQGGHEHAVDGQYDGHNRALDRMVLDAGFYPANFRAGWLANSTQLQEWVERRLFSDDGGNGWATAWRPYHPAAADYTASGEMEHWMVNIPGGPTQAGADSAFAQALAEGRPVVYGWGMHQRDDMRYYVAVAHSMVQAAARAHPGVPFRYVTAREAVQAIAGAADTTPPALAIRAAGGGAYRITASEPLGGDGPYVAGRYGSGSVAVYEHVPAVPAGPPGTWTATLPPTSGSLPLDLVGAGALDRAGNSAVETFRPGTASVVGAATPVGACVSTAHPCAAVPVGIVRADVAAVRSYRVGFHLSPELAPCGAGVEGSVYLGEAGTTEFQVVDRGGGAYEVSEALTGPATEGAGTGDGTLFTVYVTDAAAGGSGMVAIDYVQVSDGAGDPVPVEAGPAASVTIDRTGPPALTDLDAQPVAGGGDRDGTVRTAIRFPAPPDGSRVEVYRKAYGGYPDYRGVAPLLPESPEVADSEGWTLTPVTASGQTDDPPARDCWYYVAYTVDGCGNATASGPSGGVLNYLLGDASDGRASCAGDNAVDMADVTLLGARYGARSGEPGYLACLDVGPTVDGGLGSRPTPDGVLEFDDLVLLALNYSVLGGPGPAALAAVRTGPAGAAAAAASVDLETPALPGVGEVFTVALRARGGTGVQAARIVLDYDRSVLAMGRADPGELLARQAAPGIVLSPGPGLVDVALLGRGAGLGGEGVLATATFRVLAPGDPGLRLASLDARDADNRKVAWGGATAAPTLPLPAVTALAAARPNPFAQTVTIAFSLAESGPAEIVVYSAGGRRVRTLARGERPAGEHAVAWDGRDDAGRTVPAGVYHVRLATAGHGFTRKVTYLR